MNNTQALGYLSYASEVVSDHSAFVSGYMAMSSPISRRHVRVPIIVSMVTKILAEALQADSRIKSVYETIRPEIPKESESLNVIDSVWEAYKDYSASKLSNMTHVEGTPWQVIYDQYSAKPPKGTDIPQDEIKKYFNNLLEGV